MRPLDIKSCIFIDFNKKILKRIKNLVGDHVKISNYKNIYAKGYVTNWSEEVL